MNVQEYWHEFYESVNRYIVFELTEMQIASSSRESSQDGNLNIFPLSSTASPEFIWSECFE